MIETDGEREGESDLMMMIYIYIYVCVYVCVDSSNHFCDKCGRKRVQVSLSAQFIRPYATSVFPPSVCFLE